MRERSCGKRRTPEGAAVEGAAPRRRARRSLTGARARAFASLAWLLVGCGAKTGLHAPKRDAGMDAAMDASVPCVEIPIDGGPVNAALELEAEVGRADVVFVIDTTSSMGEEIQRIRGRLRDQIAPAVREAIPDSQLAVTTFADFPVSPYGTPGDQPFVLVVPSTSDIARVQAGVDAIGLDNGLDTPESHVEALYQLATGEGLAGYVAPVGGCPRGGIGYACLRTDALPVVLLFTDERMHEGPGGSERYNRTSLRVTPHTYDDAVRVLNAIGARVIGFDSGGGNAAADLRAIARDTATLDEGGRPLVYDIGQRGERLGREVVNAIRTFATTIVQDVGAVPSDPDPGDGIDVLTFVEAIRPLSADPMTGVGAIDFDANVFREVRAGTLLTFQITIVPGAVVPGPTARRVRLEIIFRGNGRTRLGSRIVELVIPGADGTGCEDATNGP